MMNQSGAAEPPVVTVTVEAPPALAAAAGSDRAGVLAAVQDQFQRRLQRLGVAGSPALRLHPGEAARAVRVRVHQRLQPFSPELMERVWLAVAPDRADVPQRQANLSQAGFPDGWFRSFVEDLTAADATDGDWELALRFTGQLAVEAVFEHPACLLAADQAVPPTGEAGREAGLPPTEFREALEELLAMGSMPSVAAVAEALTEGARQGTPLRDTIEALAAAWRTDRLEIQVSSSDFQAVVPTVVEDRSLPLYEDPVAENEREAFKQMEQELFAAQGVRLPPLFLRRVDDLPAGMLRLAVNNLVTPPAPCSPSLTEGVKAELRRQASRLLSIEDVEYMLARLDGVFPELVSATLEQVPLGDLTRVLRALLEEGVRIRDLRAILERLLQYDTVPVDANRYCVLDDRLPLPIDPPPPPAPPWSRYLAFVRSGRGLQNHLSHTYRVGGPVALQVRAIHLAEQLEERVRDAVAAGAGRPDSGGTWEETQAAVLAAVWEELSSLPDRAAPVVLLVRDPLTRRVVRDQIAGELPTLPVVVTAELRPDIEIVRADAHPSGADTSAPQPRPPSRRARLHGRRFPYTPARRAR
jgi:hypothetical protein